MSRRRYSYYDYYSYYPESKPVETDQGIKARSQKGKFVKNWWAQRWITALERLIDAGRLRRGKRYARQGQVLSLEEAKKGITAKVQGSRRAPYKVTLTIEPLTPAQWEKVIDALAGQAIFTAQLLAGEMPQDIEAAFTEAGVSLFPDKSNDLATECSCPDYANPCKHVAAVHYILGEQFDEDPFMLFRLRGRSQDQILQALRDRRAETEEFEEEVEEVVVPLEETIDNFWGAGQPARITTSIKAPITEFPILKRLGQPNFVDEDLIAALGPAYRAITESAIAAAFGDETNSNSI